MRRVFSVCSVFLLIVTFCFIFPVTGRALSSTTEPSRYSVLQFDEIRADGLSFPCPFNFSSPGTNRDAFNFLDGYVSGFVSLGDVDFDLYGFLTVPSDAPFTLVSCLQLVRMADLKGPNSYEVWPGNSTTGISTVSISAWGVELADGRDFTPPQNKVLAVQTRLTGTLYPNENGVVDFGKGLYDLLVSSGFDSKYVMLSDLQITVNHFRNDVNTPQFSFSCITNLYSADNFPGTWVMEENIVIPEIPAQRNDYMSWLTNSVESFLDFEIAPGLSVNKILYIILVIGVLLWFITLLI